MLFFSTVWVGEIFTSQALAADPSAPIASEAFQDEATRAGSRALLWSSILSFAASVLLPFVVHQSSIEDKHQGYTNGSASGLLPGYGRKGTGDWARIIDWLAGMKLHLATLWAISHAIFAISMALT